MQDTSSVMSPNCHAIIPARYASSRLEAKALALIDEKPMFWHVYMQAKKAKSLCSVTLATDDERIKKAAKNFDIPCIMTKASHKSGTDRVHEAAQILGLEKDSVIVNIQGDEPLLEPAMLDALTGLFVDKSVQVGTLSCPISAEEAASPHCVKLVLDGQKRALYFSRAPIPFVRDTAENTHYLGHIGLYAFQMQALQQFVLFPQGRLEGLEKLEQLRFLENGIPIHVEQVAHRSLGVDTPEDLEYVRALFAQRKVDKAEA